MLWRCWYRSLMGLVNQINHFFARNLCQDRTKAANRGQYWSDQPRSRITVVALIKDNFFHCIFFPYFIDKYLFSLKINRIYSIISCILFASAGPELNQFCPAGPIKSVSMESRHSNRSAAKRKNPYLRPEHSTHARTHAGTLTLPKKNSS